MGETINQAIRRANREFPTCFGPVQKYLDTIRARLPNDTDLPQKLANTERAIAAAKLAPFVGGLIGLICTGAACSAMFAKPEMHNDPIVFWFALGALIWSTVVPSTLLALGEVQLATDMSRVLYADRYTLCIGDLFKTKTSTQWSV